VIHTVTGRGAIAAVAIVLAAVCQPSAVVAQHMPATATSPLRPCCSHDWAGTVQPLRDTAPSLLTVSRNAAVLAQRFGASWRRFAVQGATAGGEFRRPQEAARSDQITVTAEGVQRAVGWTMVGSASYRRASDEGVAWRNTSDAYLGNVFIWADSVGGTLRRDELGLSGAIVSPAWHGVTAALHLDYGIGQGARRNDPKPLFRRRIAEVSPALAYTVGRHTIGVGAVVGWQREDLEIGGGASAEFPVVFRLRGMGTFDRTQLISAERAMLGGVTGAQLGWSRTGDRWVIAIGGTVRVERDSIRDGIATPVSGGATRRVRGDGQVALRHRSDDGGTDVSAALRNEEARGVDPVFRAVNVIDDGTAAATRVRWWRGRDPAEARWLATIVGQRVQLLRRDLAAETTWNATMPIVTAALAHRVPMTGGAVLLGLGGGAGWRERADYAALRPSRLTPILALADYAVVSAPQRHGLATVAWERWAAGAVVSRIRLDGLLVRTAAALADARPALTRTNLSLTMELY
jgi:hypothetical protein